MEMIAFLLVSAASQLISPASCAPSKLHPNLKAIIDEVNEYNDTLAKDHFVEDVQKLHDAGCKEDFFCKVLAILETHANSTHPSTQEQKILRNLEAFTAEMKCGEKTKMEANTVRTPITALLEFLKKCSRTRNSFDLN